MSIPKNHQAVLEFVNNGEIQDGILVMSTLWSMDKHGNYRYWILSIGIENEKGEKINVTEEYIDRKKLPDNYYGVYWTESGIEHTQNPIISEKTIVTSGKNVKSKNYTTAFTQAIIDAKSDYNFKIRKGHVVDKDLLNLGDKVLTLSDLINQTHRGKKPWRIFGMALHDVNKNKNWRHVKYPCIIQPKLDGTMFIVVAHPDLPEITISNGDHQIKANIDGYSRGREDYGKQDHILYELYSVLKRYPGLHLIGELWKKGYGLQDISGSSRRKLDSKIKEDAVKLDYNIFDCFYLDKLDETFENRMEYFDDINMYLNTGNKKANYVKIITCYTVENKKELMEKYQSFLDENLEGGVIRNLDSKCEIGIDKEKRSYTTLKIKPRFDSEWPVIGFKEGKGKELGAVIWICAESNEGVTQRLKLTEKDAIPEITERKTFTVTPNQDYETRYKIFKNLTKNKTLFEKKIKGELYTVSYSQLSTDLLPQQPKGIRFKNEKINTSLLE